jgi:hypothetical protein
MKEGEEDQLQRIAKLPFKSLWMFQRQEACNDPFCKKHRAEWLQMADDYEKKGP